MQTIHKFPLAIEDTQEVRLPAGAEVLSIQVQHGTPCLWALVQPGVETETRTIYCFGTGHPVAPKWGQLKFLATVQLHGGGLVFHFFECVPIAF